MRGVLDFRWGHEWKDAGSTGKVEWLCRQRPDQMVKHKERRGLQSSASSLYSGLLVSSVSGNHILRGRRPTTVTH
jgi:hypothetical protein